MEVSRTASSYPAQVHNQIVFAKLCAPLLPPRGIAGRCRSRDRLVQIKHSFSGALTLRTYVQYRSLFPFPYGLSILPTNGGFHELLPARHRP